MFLPVSRRMPGDLPLCFWGPSGRGKSTLLRILAGFSQQYHGRIFWEGRDLKSISPMDRAKFRHQFLRMHWQHQNLFPELSVMDTVKMVCKDPSQVEPWIKEQCDFLGLDPGQPVATLSWGERQRAALIRTLADRPKLVFIDEPFSSLDPQTAETLGQWLVRVRKEKNLALVLTAHDQSLPFPADFVLLEAADGA